MKIMNEGFQIKNFQKGQYKGQYFSFDAIIGAVIFSMALVALLSYWHAVQSALETQNDETGKETVRISNVLFSPAIHSPVSSNDCATFERGGFAVGWEDRRLNSTALDCISQKASAERSWL